MTQADLNLLWADSLLAGFVAGGVAGAVLSPGSRSTALALACESRPDFPLWIIPDERSAAFFALGLARGADRPYAVIGTSGSAPANWFPAVLEASLDHVPLLLVSADRPPELQACGANQTVDQLHLFGHHARAFYDLGPPRDRDSMRFAADAGARSAAGSRWPTPGPVHVNAPFREPLVPERIPAPRQYTAPISVTTFPDRVSGDVVEQLERCLSARLGVIVCGRVKPSNSLAEHVARIAERLDCPVFADPLSQLRFGPHDRSRVCSHHALLMQALEGDARPGVEWALIFGGAPVSRSLQNYLSRVPQRVIVSPYGDWPDPHRDGAWVIRTDPVTLCAALEAADLRPSEEVRRPDFIEIEARVRARLGNLQMLPLEVQVLRSVFARCGDGSRVFCGNSLAIRDVDAYVHGGPRRIAMYGNRGVSGIDGNVSSALGLAARGSGRVVGLLGDLALYHDMNGLLAGTGLDATLVVMNNGGGGIFGTMPQAALKSFGRLWKTPTGLEPARIAELYGFGFARTHRTEEFVSAFDASLGRRGVDLIEVVIDLHDSLHRRHAVLDEVKRALAGS